MIPGPTIIRKCSHCSGLIQQQTLTSGNTFGAIYWTDGKMDAPMLPDYPPLMKCPHCRSAVWIRQLGTVDEIDPLNTMNTNAEAPLPLEIEDYASFLEGNRLLKPGVERDVRIRAWWRGNDERRRGHNSGFTKIEVQNLAALTKLLDETDAMERLMLAEIKRELGDFDQALALLEQLSDEELNPAVAVIRELSEHGDSVVAQIYADLA